MSVKVMGSVFDADLPRDEKYILLSYADHAAHDGTNIYPSIARMVWKTGYSERSVQSITRKLTEKGILIPDGHGPNWVNKWRIVFSELPTRPEFEGGAESAGVQISTEGVQITTEGGANSAPNPSLNRPNNRQLGADAPTPQPQNENPITPHMNDKWIDVNTIPQSEEPPDDDFEGMVSESVALSASPPPSLSEADILAASRLASAKARLKLGDEVWRDWGYHSHAVVGRPGISTGNIQQVGYLLSNDFGLVPDWSDKKETRDWVSQCAKLWTACGGELDDITKAGKRLRGGDRPMTLSGPRSFIKTTRAIAAERRSPGSATGGRKQWRTLPPMEKGE